MAKYNILTLYEIYKNTTFYRHIAEVMEIAAPLRKLGLECFSLMKYDNNNNLTWITNYEAGLETYLKQPRFMYEEPLGTHSRLLQPGEYFYDKIFEKAHGKETPRYFKGFCVVKDNSNGERELFFFELINPSFNDYGRLHAFIEEFKDKAKPLIATADQVYMPHVYPKATPLNMIDNLLTIQVHAFTGSKKLITNSQYNYCKCLQVANQHELTYKETQCLNLLIQGKLNKQIADTLGLSIKTVESYLNKIRLKLQCLRKNEIAAKTLLVGSTEQRTSNSPNFAPNQDNQWELYSKIMAPYNLTKREVECLKLIISGHQNKQIAEELNLSIKTIEVYTDRIKSKLKCRNKIAIIAKVADIYRNTDQEIRQGLPKT